MLGALVWATACKGSRRDETMIAVDGSSTVYPITVAVAEEFRRKGVAEVAIGVSGTGGGFGKLCAREAVINGASRPIKPSEARLCERASVQFIELPIAYDGIAIVVHRDNTWVDKLTVADLRKLWSSEAQGTVLEWSDIRAEWPDEEVHLFGPGVDSGTYDYFTRAILGTQHTSRTDFQSSEDDNVLAQAISEDTNALGYFGYGHFAENEDRLKAVPVDDGNEGNGAGAIAPSRKSIETGNYQPLSRPLFIYVSSEASGRDEVEQFVEFYLTEVKTLARQAGYIPLTDEEYGLVSRRFEKRTTGSVFGGEDPTAGLTVARQLGQDSGE